MTFSTRIWREFSLRSESVTFFLFRRQSDMAVAIVDDLNIIYDTTNQTYFLISYNDRSESETVYQESKKRL